MHILAVVQRTTLSVHWAIGVSRDIEVANAVCIGVVVLSVSHVLAVI